MGFVADVARGAAVAVTAGPAAPTASRGSLSVRGDVSLVPGPGGDRAVRMTGGHVVVDGVGDVTSGNVTVQAWLRAAEAPRGRVVVSRRQGVTEVTVGIGADGRPSVVVASAAGPYRVSLAGVGRVDDGRWHQLAVVVAHKAFSRVEVSLVVDGRVVQSGQMRPGLFGVSPDLSMTVPLQVGGLDGGLLLGGDLLVLAVREEAVPVSRLAAAWAALLSDRAAVSGWGIPLV